MTTTTEPKPVIQGKIDLPEHRRVLEEAGVAEIRYSHRSEPYVYTMCYIYKGIIPSSTGIARCHPRDQFCRKTGRIVALRKAIHNLDLKGRRNNTGQTHN